MFWQQVRVKGMNSRIQKTVFWKLIIDRYCIIRWSVSESPLIQDIILVTGEEMISYCKKEIVERYNFTKVTKVIAGGKERYDSVYQGLLACEDCDYVFIHDGARPFVTEAMLERGVFGVQETGAAQLECRPRIQSKFQIKRGLFSQHRTAAGYGLFRHLRFLPIADQIGT